MINKGRGFTVVELLIVIVVVAILAAITVVAYSGVQARAENSAREANMNGIKKNLERYRATYDRYPESITDCPNPAATNLCLTDTIKSDIEYKSVTSNSYGAESGKWTSPGYTLAVMDKNQFVFQANFEQRGNNEFNRFVDIAPYIDRYGLGTYELSFDLRSEDISRYNRVQVYLQNGSNMRYFFTNTIPVTAEYSRYSIEVTPTVSNLNVQEAYLAFYGSYSTGNVPVVKNVTLQKKQ